MYSIKQIAMYNCNTAKIRTNIPEHEFTNHKDRTKRISKKRIFSPINIIKQCK